MKSINKAFKYRIYPTKPQIAYIEKMFAGCRVVYNCLLYDTMKEREENPEVKQKLSAFAFSYKVKQLKQQDDKKWLYECDSKALIFEAHNLADSFKKFFWSLKNRPQDAGRPRFKHKDMDTQSFRTYQDIAFSNGLLKIPKLKNTIKVVEHREFQGELKQVAISRKNGKYYCSLLSQMEIDDIEAPVKKTVGMDFGVSDFATTTDGMVIKNPAFLLESSKYLAKLQQKKARAVKGSNNYKKIKHKIACLHEKVARKRKQFHYETIRDLLSEYDKIYIQNLSTKKMTKKKDDNFEGFAKNKLNRKVLDAAPASFHTKLLYKADWEGKQVEKIEKHEATTATCNKCGAVTSRPQIKKKKWACSGCGVKLHRDANASKNILKAGSKNAGV